MTRVLLLEDNHEVAVSLLEALHLRGIDVFHSTTVADARRQYDSGWYDFLVIDYELPDGTGLDFLADVDTGEATTILYSGLDRSRELAAAGLEVDYSISKSDPFALLDVLEGKTR